MERRGWKGWEGEAGEKGKVGGTGMKKGEETRGRGMSREHWEET